MQARFVIMVAIAIYVFALVACDSNELKSGHTWYYTSDKKMMAAVAAELELRKVPFYRHTNRKGEEGLAYPVKDKAEVLLAIGELVGVAPVGYSGLCTTNGLARAAHVETLTKAGVRTITANPKFTGEFCVFWLVEDEDRVVQIDAAYRQFKNELGARHATR